jgi:hypothetical protein
MDLFPVLDAQAVLLRVENTGMSIQVNTDDGTTPPKPTTRSCGLDGVSLIR